MYLMRIKSSRRKCKSQCLMSFTPPALRRFQWVILQSMAVTYFYLLSNIYGNAKSERTANLQTLSASYGLSLSNYWFEHLGNFFRGIIEMTHTHFYISYKFPKGLYEAFINMNFYLFNFYKWNKQDKGKCIIHFICVLAKALIETFLSYKNTEFS